MVLMLPHRGDHGVENGIPGRLGVCRRGVLEGGESSVYERGGQREALQCAENGGLERVRRGVERRMGENGDAEMRDAKLPRIALENAEDGARDGGDVEGYGVVG